MIKKERTKFWRDGLIHFCEYKKKKANYDISMTRDPQFH